MPILEIHIQNTVDVFTANKQSQSPDSKWAPDLPSRIGFGGGGVRGVITTVPGYGEAGFLYLGESWEQQLSSYLGLRIIENKEDNPIVTSSNPIVQAQFLVKKIANKHWKYEIVWDL